MVLPYHVLFILVLDHFLVVTTCQLMLTVITIKYKICICCICCWDGLDVIGLMEIIAIGLELIGIGLTGVGDDTFIIQSMITGVVCMAACFELKQTTIVWCLWI